MLNKLWRILLLAYLFLLPWQTRWIYESKYLNGQFWEYGSASLFASEIILWSVVLIYFFDRFKGPEVRHLFGKYHWSTHKYNLFLSLGFIAFIILGVVHSEDPSLSYEYFFHLILYLCLFVILISLEEKKWFFTAAWAGAVVQGALAAVQFFSQTVFANKWLGLAFHSPDQLGAFVIESGSERWLRAYGSFGSPNILGGFLAVMLILGLILYLNSRPAEKIYLTLGQVIIFIGLVLSFSRGAYLSVGLGIIMVGVFALRASVAPGLPWYSRFHPLGMYIKQCIFYTLVLVAMTPVLAPTSPVRFSLDSRLEKKSVSDRLAQFSEAALVSRQRPWLGVGPGAYTYALSKIKPGEPAYNYQPVHNSFYLLFAEWGSVGAAIWLALFGALLALVKKRNQELLPIIFAMLVSAVFDHFWWSLPGGLALWWTVFGLAI